MLVGAWTMLGGSWWWGQDRWFEGSSWGAWGQLCSAAVGGQLSGVIRRALQVLAQQQQQHLRRAL